jgi:hypothetical protein
MHGVLFFALGNLSGIAHGVTSSLNGNGTRPRCLALADRDPQAAVDITWLHVVGIRLLRQLDNAPKRTIEPLLRVLSRALAGARRRSFARSPAIVGSPLNGLSQTTSANRSDCRRSESK